MTHIRIILILGISIVLSSYHTYGQNFKQIVNQSEQVIIQLISGDITLVESSGAELEISASNFEGPKEIPEKAKGLKPIGGSDIKDNTGLGLQVTKEGNTLIVTSASNKMTDVHYTFKIPKGVNCKIDCSSPFAQGDIGIKGISSELDISTLNNRLLLEQVYRI